MDDFKVIFLVFFLSTLLNTNAIEIIRQNEIVHYGGTDDAAQYLVQPTNTNRKNVINFTDADKLTKLANEAINNQKKTSKTVHENIKVTIRKHSTANSNDGSDNENYVSYASWNNLNDNSLHEGGNKDFSYVTGVTRQGFKDNDSNIKYSALSSKSDEFKESNTVGRDVGIINTPVSSGFHDDVGISEYDVKPLRFSESSKIVETNENDVSGNQNVNADKNRITESGLNVNTNKLIEKDHTTSNDVSDNISNEHSSALSVPQTNKTRDKTDGTNKIVTYDNTVFIEDHNHLNTNNDIIYVPYYNAVYKNDTLPEYNNTSNQQGPTVNIQDKPDDNNVSDENQKYGLDKPLGVTANGNSSTLVRDNTDSDVAQKTLIDNMRKSTYINIHSVTEATMKNKPSVEIGKPDDATGHTIDKNELKVTKTLVKDPKRDGMIFSSESLDGESLTDNVIQQNFENLKNFWVLLDQYVYRDQGKSVDLYRYGKLFTLLNIFTKLNEVREKGVNIDIIIDNLIEILDHALIDFKIEFETKKSNSGFKNNKFIAATNKVVTIERDLQDDKIYVRKYETKLDQMSFPKKDGRVHYGVEEFIKNYILWPKTDSEVTPVIKKRVLRVKNANIDIEEIPNKGDKHEVTKGAPLNDLSHDASTDVITKKYIINGQTTLGSEIILAQDDKDGKNPTSLSKLNDALLSLNANNSQANDRETNHDFLVNIDKVKVTSLTDSKKKADSIMFDDNFNKNPIINTKAGEVGDVADIKLTKPIKSIEPLVLDIPVTENIVKEEKHPINVHSQPHKSKSSKNIIRIQDNIGPDYKANYFLNTFKVKQDKDDADSFIIEHEKPNHALVNPIKHPEQDLHLGGIDSNALKQTSHDTFVEDKEFPINKDLYQILLQMDQPDGLKTEKQISQSDSNMSILWKRLKEENQHLIDSDTTQPMDMSTKQNFNLYWPLWQLLYKYSEITKPKHFKTNDYYVSNNNKPVEIITITPKPIEVMTKKPLKGNNLKEISLPKLPYSNSPHEDGWINHLTFPNSLMDWSKHSQLIYNLNGENVPKTFYNQHKRDPTLNVHPDLIKLLEKQLGKDDKIMDKYNNPFGYDIMKHNPYFKINNKHIFKNNISSSYGMRVPELMSFDEQQRGNYKTPDNKKLNRFNIEQSDKQLLNIVDIIKRHFKEKGMEDEVIGKLISNVNGGLSKIEKEKCATTQHRQLLDKIHEAVQSAVSKS